jgi:cell division protein FtsQ
MKAPELRTSGVLDDAWLARVLKLPKSAALVELDLEQLRRRLLAEDQVVSATLTKRFPDRLIVQLTERSPVARVMTQWLGQQKALLVARDGVVYDGEGYDPAVLESLPWLDGVKLVPNAGHFVPLANMSVTAELLNRARIEAEHLYSTWSVVSLAKVESDRKIEVRTKDGLGLYYFSTNDDFFRQLAKLDYITDQLSARAPGAKVNIDLSLGSDVPVSIRSGDDSAPISVTTSRPQPPPPAGAAVFVLPASVTSLSTRTPPSSFSQSQPRKIQREF